MNSSRIVPALLSVALLAALQLPTAAQNAGRAASRTWDYEIVLPAGGYRAGKAITNGSGMKVNVQPGAVLDGIEFSGESDPKWTVEGAWLRKMRIIGALGTRMDAKDSVFDDCTMHRVGGWFVSWWGTRWHFNNCVIGNKFLLAELDPGNYAVRAERCTFVGIKMPDFKLKEDPSKYFQRDDLKFDHCRFVQCEIPESVLAASIDCVFEGCRFDRKRNDWKKAGAPIKVNAIVPDSANRPASYLNGQLSVTFVAGAGIDAGSTVAYSSTGGRVSPVAIKAPGQFTMLGTTDKKASELMESPLAIAATTTKPSLPGIAPVVPPPQPVAGEVRNLDEILRSIPAAVEPISGGAVNPPAVETANVWLGQSFSGKTISLRIKLEELQATKDNGYLFQVVSRELPLTYRGVAIPAKVVAYFRADRSTPLNKIPKGGDLNLRGVINKAELQGRGRGLFLSVTVGEAAAL